ncbi:SMI1/KNR4 family protein [Paenilisteria rocourtiae]|nr:SMI1/KNR4 family protein [Listeria rocourtiae]
MFQPQNLRKTYDGVLRNTKLARENGLSNQFVAIADDGTGDLLCLRIGNSKQMLEEIYLGSHESGKCEQMYSNLVELIMEQ